MVMTATETKFFELRN